VKKSGSIVHHCNAIELLAQIVGHDSTWKRRMQAQKLKADISSNKDIDMTEEIHILLPDPESHKNHVMGQVKIGIILSYYELFLLIT
jgi:hypothetical protein